MPEKFNHALHDPAGAAIHAKEKNSEKSHCDNHDPGRHKNFVPRRPCHLSHFDANFMQKTAPPPVIFAEFLERLGYRVPAPFAALTSSLILHLECFRHKLFQILPDLRWPSPSPAEVAGEEGFEPPLSVLETDGLPLNLLPFALSGN